MVHHDRAEFFGRFDSVLFSEQVDSVLLGVSRDDFLVVTDNVCCFVDELELRGDFELADGVVVVVAMDMEELDGALAVPMVAQLEAAAGVRGGGERGLRAAAGAGAENRALSGARV